jgi:hypothetical protein
VKTLVAKLIVAAVLLGTGEIVRRWAQIEGQIAAAEEDLAVLALDAADAGYKAIEERMQLTGRLPFIGPRLLVDIRQAHNQVAYWRGAHQNVPTESELMAPEVTAEQVFLAANASFRNGAETRRGQAGAEDLDAVLRMYALHLKKDPNSVDGSFNYEFVVRLRNVLANNTIPNLLGMSLVSLHGETGSPPKDMKQEFNVIVPLAPEERPEEDTGSPTDAGAGGPTNRKG